MAQRDLKNFVLFVDGAGQAGVIEEAKLPDLEFNTEEWRGGGMAGPRQILMGMSAMTMEITARDVNRSLLNLFGVQDSPNLVIRAAASDAKGEVSAVKVTANGSVKKVEMGTLKPGSATNEKFEVALHYYKFEDAGAVVHEIDFDNNICVVNGTDLMAEERTAMGI